MNTRYLFIFTLIFLSALFPDSALHSDILTHGEHTIHLNGASLSMMWILPFMGILLSIALVL